MKKIAALAIALFMALGIISNPSHAEEPSLIQNAQISLKSTENPKRLEVGFDLTEPINLANGSSNIIFEYFTEDSNGNLTEMNYKKDRSWSGYLNSYDEYGEHKFSSGAENAAYSDDVPATTLLTSVRSSASIDVTLVAAVRISVIRADGTGERVIIYIDGTVSPIEEIDIRIPVAVRDEITGIRLESTTANIPEDTVLITNEITSGPIFETISAVLTDVINFISFQITLESDGIEIQPDGKVKISIPIPQNFDSSHLAVYRIDIGGTKTPYLVTVTTIEGVNYATFEADHFSTYVLAEVTNEQVETPKTGTAQTIDYITAIAVISAIGIVVFHKITKVKNI